MEYLLAEVSGTPGYKFNPRGIMCDEACTIPVPVIVLYLCRTLVSFHTNLNSTELHLQGVAPRSQYSDPAPEVVTLQ